MTDEQFSYWLVGLVDGEGHFGVTKYFKTDGSGPYFRCVFRVTLANVDRKVLVLAHERTGWGKLYEYARKTRKANGTLHHPFIVWTVNAKNGLQDVLDFFTKYPLQSKKSEEFVVWSRAAKAHIARSRQATPESNSAQRKILATCYDQLRALRSY